MCTKSQKIEHLLTANTYPGRGILIGRTPNGKKAVAAYFIMGRSENSRNRVFVPQDGGIRTEAFDPAKLKDPSLIIYAPVRTINGMTIVTNGDQTDTVYEYLQAGKTFEAALRSRTFEPDEPNFTPRISGLIFPDGSYSLSILKSADGDPTSTRRYFFTYSEPIAGQAHFIHTYDQDGDPLPSFTGEPKQVETVDCIDAYTDLIWSSLNTENKISLYVQYIDLTDGTSETRLRNKNQ